MAQPAGDGRKRVKVYELKANDWFDRGTGFCTGLYENEEASLHVQSEEEPSRTLLETKIKRGGGYQKQQDTLIVWTEPEQDGGIDMALSFQEADGCGQIWEFVNEMQQRLGGVANGELMGHDGLDDPSENALPIMLPPPELSNLPDIEAMLRGANNSNAGREALTRFVVHQDYIGKLVPLVEMAEDLESLVDLHRLCNIMKTLILLNDTAIMEHIVSDDMILGVVGALEYDPDFPLHKANHRVYLSDSSRFKEVVKIDNPDIVRRIHQTYRLQYLKDVVLARILDDPTFSVLNSLIYYYQIDIVQHIQGNSAFLAELFGIFQPNAGSAQRKKDAVLFIQSCCSVSKTLQPSMKNNLFSNFLLNGLFGVIVFALRHPDAAVRVAGVDILIILIEHDSMLVRGHLFKALAEKTRPLTDTLIELLLVETDLGVKSQEADAIKVLLDPTANQQCMEAITRSNQEVLKSLKGGVVSDVMIQDYYNASCRKLFKPLKDLAHRDNVVDLNVQEAALFGHLVEILSYFARQHNYRSRQFMVEDALASRVAQLLSCPEKHIKLTALKFFRCCISLHDDFHSRQMIANRLFEPILNIVYETMPRDNLLNSACLEIFEQIKREHLKSLIDHLVENYRERLEEITYVDTFQNLILKYDQSQEPHPDMDHSFTSADTEPPPPAHRLGSNAPPVTNGLRWQGLKEDPEQEAYFAAGDDDDEEVDPTHDDEDDENTLPSSHNKSMTNGTSLLKQLVNYPEDEDDEMDIAIPPDDDAETGILRPDAEAEAEDTRKSSPTLPALSDDPSSTATTDSLPRTPPERISEKRRRDEDEEDALSQLASGTKRRSSLGAAQNENLEPKEGESHGPGKKGLRRKGALAGKGKEAGAGAGRIQIALGGSGKGE